MTTFGLSVHTRLNTQVRTGRSHGCLLALDASAFTIYSAPRVDDAVGYLVDIVYLGGPPPPLPRHAVIRMISLLNVTYRP